jgi:hypothetical protein
MDCDIALHCSILTPLATHLRHSQCNNVTPKSEYTSGYFALGQNLQRNFHRSVIVEILKVVTNPPVTPANGLHRARTHAPILHRFGIVIGTVAARLYLFVANR